MKLIRASIMFTLFFIVLTGFIFPGIVYGIAQATMPGKANGSLITDAKGKVVGSALIGQNFAKPAFFHPRPSAAGNGYDANNSSGTNLGPTSDKLINGVNDPKAPSNNFDGIKQLAEAYRKENGMVPSDIVPIDAVTRSASGLDPDISVRNAELQATRVAKARKMSVDAVIALVRANTEGRWLGIYGEPRVNVLQLNLALEK